MSGAPAEAANKPSWRGLRAAAWRTAGPPSAIRSKQQFSSEQTIGRTIRLSRACYASWPQLPKSTKAFTTARTTTHQSPLGDLVSLINAAFLPQQRLWPIHKPGSPSQLRLASNGNRPAAAWGSAGLQGSDVAATPPPIRPLVDRWAARAKTIRTLPHLVQPAIHPVSAAGLAEGGRPRRAHAEPRPGRPGDRPTCCSWCSPWWPLWGLWGRFLVRHVAPQARPSVRCPVRRARRIARRPESKGPFPPWFPGVVRLP